MTARSDWEWAQVWDDPDAFVRLDGGMYSNAAAREATMHMPVRRPAGFTAEIPPSHIRVSDLSKKARKLARKANWEPTDLLPYDIASYFEAKGDQ